MYIHRHVGSQHHVWIRVEIGSHPHNVTCRRDQDNGNNVVGSETMLPDHRSMAPSGEAAPGCNHRQLARDDKAAVGVDEEILDGAKLDATLVSANEIKFCMTHVCNEGFTWVSQRS